MIFPKELNELKKVNNWTAYKLVDDKVEPIDPETGGKMIINEDTHLLSYNEAKKIVKKYKLDGVGFKFAQEYGCIELRNVCPFLRMMAIANDIIKIMDSYTEWTPTRDGVFIIYKADSAKNLCFSTTFDLSFTNELKNIQENEIIPITGNAYGEIKSINKRDKQIDVLSDFFIHKSILKNHDSLYRNIYDEIAEDFLKSCATNQLRINFTEEKGVTVELTHMTYMSIEEEASINKLLENPRIHAAIILRLAFKYQRVGSIFYSLYDYGTELWKRGLPCSLEDAALAIVNSIDLTLLPEVASEVASEEVRRDFLKRLAKANT